MPYKRTPAICPVCTKPFMQRPHVQTCSTACGYTFIRQRTDEHVAARINRDDPLIDRFPEYGPCWVFTGGLNHNGYGRLHRRDEMDLAHRRAWIEATGDTLTTDDVIGHVCDNRPCVRNDSIGTYEADGDTLPRRGHLFKGEHRHNVADKVAKGRHNRGNTHYYRVRPETIRRGEQVGNARLNDDLVRYLRRRYAAGGVTHRDLSEETGISQLAICRAVRGDSWKHVV